MDTAITPTSPIRWNWLACLGLLGILGLVIWQGWMTLALFGGADAWERLRNDQPVLSGYHPLHQYHGYLGAQAILSRGRCCCYDPAFQAGYPKTPIFDSGSRFAELFMLLGGGEFSPAAYKLGLAVLLCCIPLLVTVSARGAGLSWWETFLATLLAQLVAWGVPARDLLTYGEMDLLVAAVLFQAQLGLLIHYDRAPGIWCWFGSFALGALGWFAHPLLFGLLIPLLLCYYLSAGVRHRGLLWHVGLWGGQGAALAVNAVWLMDWVHHWWIRSPLPPSLDTLPHRTFRTLWESSLWGVPADRAVAVFLMAASFVGVILINRRKRQRATARLFGLAAAALLFLALLGVGWEPLGRFGTAELLAPALWFMTVPAARAVTRVGRWLANLEVLPPLRWGLIGAVVVVAGLFSKEHVAVLAARAQGVEPLALGLGQDQQELLHLLKENTTNQARILWEDQPGPRDASRWTALLPLLTGRAYIGGMDPDGRIEHSHVGFVRSILAGRPLAEWSETALQDYCRRYNVGWIVVWSTSALERFRAWQDVVEEVCELKDGKTGCLFKVRRDNTGFALYGQAELVEADGNRLILTNVVPRDGKVVLSFHYQTGLRATPARVQIEREPDILDPIPLLRLKLSAPVSRLVLTWDGH